MSINFSLLKYRNPVFVETGTNKGYGVQCALNACFGKIYSIELSKELYEKCKAKFANQVQNGKVELLLGDSSVKLIDVLKQLSQRATFWLDAHWSADNPETVRGDIDVPLMKELELIHKHCVKTHTILIDDVKAFGKTDKEDWSNVQLDLVIKKLKSINSGYKIFFEKGKVANDVLVAEIPRFSLLKIWGGILEITYPPALKILKKHPFILKIVRKIKRKITK